MVTESTVYEMTELVSELTDLIGQIPVFFYFFPIVFLLGNLIVICIKNILSEAYFLDYVHKLESPQALIYTSEDFTKDENFEESEFEEELIEDIPVLMIARKRCKYCDSVFSEEKSLCSNCGGVLLYEYENVSR